MPIYPITITNAIGSGSVDFDYTVPISDILLTSTDIEEHKNIGSIVGVLSTNDSGAGGTYTYSLINIESYPENEYFYITDDTLYTNSVFDYVSQTSYTINIRTTSSENLTFDKEFTINVTNVAESPTGCILDNYYFWENNSIGSLVGTISVEGDPDPTAYTFEVTQNSDKFEVINGNQLVTKISFDAEDYDVVTWVDYDLRRVDVTIKTTELTSSSEVFTTLSVWVRNIDAILSNYYATEGFGAGRIYGYLAPRGWDFETYPVGTTFTLLNETDTFEIVGNEFRTKVELDAEQWTWWVENELAYKSINVEVYIPDVGTDIANFWVWLYNVDEPFTGITFNHPPIDADPFPDPPWARLDENVENGDRVGFLLPTGDPDAFPELGFEYSIVDQPYDTFIVDPVVGRVYINNASHIDSDTTEYSEDVTFRITDLSLNVSVDSTITISFAEAPEAPTDIILSNESIDENQPSGTAIGSFTTTDDDIGDTFTYELVEGTGSTDNDKFQILDNELQSTETFYDEITPTLSIRVRSTDSTGNSVEKVFTITVNGLPPFISISNTNVSEGYNVGDIIGTISIENPDQFSTYTMELIDDASGTVALEEPYLIVANTDLIDYEENQTFTAVIRITDQDDNYVDNSIEFTIIDEDLLVTIIESFTPMASKTSEQPSVIVTGRYFTEGGDPNILINDVEVTPYLITDTEIRFVMPKLNTGVHTCTITNGNGL